MGAGVVVAQKNFLHFHRISTAFAPGMHLRRTAYAQTYPKVFGDSAFNMAVFSGNSCLPYFLRLTTLATAPTGK